MKRHVFTPPVNTRLEDRIALSHSGFAGAHVATAGCMASQSLTLTGFAIGNASTGEATRQLESTDSTIDPLGAASLTGSLLNPRKGGVVRAVHGTASIAGAQGKGKVTIKGKVSVYTGKYINDSGDLTYQIVSGTKAYRGAKGKGPVQFYLGQPFLPDRFELEFGNFVQPF